MTVQELTKTVRDLKELKAMAADLTAEITTLEDTLKAEMTARNTDELTVDVFKVRWTLVTSNRFDSTAFKANRAAKLVGKRPSQTYREGCQAIPWLLHFYFFRLLRPQS